MTNQEQIKFGNDTRQILCRSGFYSEEKLQDLLNMFLNDQSFANSISTYDIDATHLNIRLQIRKAYLANTGDGLNSLNFYEDQNIKRIMINFYLKRKIEIFNLLGMETASTFFDERYVNMYYFITRYGDNALMINFI